MNNDGSDDADMTNIPPPTSPDLVEIPQLLFKVFREKGVDLLPHDADNIRKIMQTLPEKIDQLRNGNPFLPPLAVEGKTWDDYWQEDYWTTGIYDAGTDEDNEQPFFCRFLVSIEPGEQTKCRVYWTYDLEEFVDVYTPSKHKVYRNDRGLEKINFMYGFRDRYSLAGTYQWGGKVGADDGNVIYKPPPAVGEGAGGDGFESAFVDMCQIIPLQ
ncbi:MAG: hypothetical protein CL678_15305 [Bdellovibrionaceae bacterium]|nr:hypothetical protein [Pseudobdellovibrionaceae bacterium]|tara:strand:+ start:385 stop:1026 length:642 start_codon:yes stop_codon:yes gene_type:complete